MKQLFDPVIDLIVELVEGQLDMEYHQLSARTIKVRFTYWQKQKTLLIAIDCHARRWIRRFAIP
jgi:hypothetical protein